VELLVVAVVAAAAGALLASLRRPARADRSSASVRSADTERPAADGGPVRAEASSAATERALHDVLLEVLDRVPAGVVIADRRGVVHRNRSAAALAGTHAGLLVDGAVERHLGEARRGRATEEVLDLYGPPKLVLVVRAVPLPDGWAVAFVDDVSERRRIDAVRTDFVANISHELKTPVGALAVLAETLVDEQDPAVVQRLADRMLEEAHRAARTIDDLLELSRIELGGEQVRDGVDVQDVVRCAVERGEALAERRHIRIAAAPGGPESLSVTGDRRQLVSAVGNLVENAVKYSDDGGTVRVRASRSGDHVEFEVVDQGVGIPSRDLDRIFERFYRVDKARSRGTGGTGLGLSIVRHVATNHGGEVLVTSREGEGSTFVLRIPVAGPTPAPSSPPRGVA
jgi:two-component system sensor histidine kinase SenX3